MTYVSKKEKVFDLPGIEENSTVSLKNCETRLKSFPSVSDRRAWTTEECQRYQHLYGLVSGSQTSISKSASFKYIPFDVLLAILMAEKDAYIQELLDRQDDKKSCCDGKANVLYRSDGFEDSDDDRDALIRKDAEMVALKNKIAGLESELDDYRDTLTKAMHKLENMDTIMSENNLLREKVRLSEKTIKCLEEQKEELEKELQYQKETSESESELEERRRRVTRQHWDGGDCEVVTNWSSERDVLIAQVKDLQKELEKARVNAAEMDVLRKMSETTLINLDEISKENECYKKKLETMKQLEKHIEELKNQAQILTEKYKKESQKANDHLKQVNTKTKELQLLREERDRLQERVGELISYENQYKALQSKRHQVELILDENDMLNKKLIQLDRLEFENEHLKMKINQLQSAEIQAVEDKERIIQLQCAVLDQEEEIRKMLRQIEELSEGYADKNEIHQLKNELDEKNMKLQQYERQLTEIPILESEIEELRRKLQKCIDDFKTDKDLLKRLQDELQACQSRCQELEMIPCHENSRTKSKETVLSSENSSITFDNKGENTEGILYQDKESQCSENEKEFLEPFELDEIIKVQELQELEERNKALKNEVEHLQSKLAEINLDDLLAQTNELKEHLSMKEHKISELESEISGLRQELSRRSCFDELKQINDEMKCEMKNLKESNELLELAVESRENAVKRVSQLESRLKTEKNARNFVSDLLKETEKKLSYETNKRQAAETLTKLQKEEANIEKQGLYLDLWAEINFLRTCKHLSEKIVRELKTENKILREIQNYSDRVEKPTLKALNRKLRVKVKTLTSLSEPELQNQVEKLLKEADILRLEIHRLRSALDSERETGKFLGDELVKLQAEITACMTAGSETLDRELAAKNKVVTELKTELARVQNMLVNSLNVTSQLKEENRKLLETYESVQMERKNLRQEIESLSAQIQEQRNLQDEIKSLSDEIEKQKGMELELSRLSAELEAYKKKEEDVMQKSTQVEKQESEESTENRERVKERNSLKEELQKFSNQIEEQNKIIQSHMAKEEENSREMKRLNEEILKRNEDLIQIKNKEEELVVKISDLQGELILKEKNMESLKKSHSELRIELAREQAEVRTLTCKLTKKIEEENLKLKAAAEAEKTVELEKRRAFEEKSDVEKMLAKIENELDELRLRLTECRKMEEELALLKGKKDSLLDKMSDFEAEIGFVRSKLSSEFLEADNEPATQELLLLRQSLAEKSEEIKNLKEENENLVQELSKAQDLVEVTKKINKNLSQIQSVPPTAEFFTPPAIPSPRGDLPTEEESLPVPMMPIETHEKQLMLLETRFREEILRLKEEKAKRFKKLSLNHEKDVKGINKVLHENISGIKSKYEKDIQRLVEKHKLSITKLQELHEEEVAELNKSYETQMVAMEEQNENLISHMQKESADKCKKMSEQHNKELKELEGKYEKLLKQKENQVQVGKPEPSWDEKATTEIPEGQRKTVDSLSQFYKNKISELDSKHNKELKKCKKSHLKITELMKNKYEDLLKEEKKRYEEQLENMLQQLKKGHQGDSFSPCESKNPNQRKNPASTRLEFHEVLQKIINEGLESLTFEELILVHSKTCFIPENMSDRFGDPETTRGGGGEIRDGVGDGCSHKELMAAEKEDLLKRIFALEWDIVIKQFETHEAIANMETAGKYKIQELRNALCNAQQKNSELKRHLTNQTKLHTDMKIEKYIMDRQVLLNESNVLEKVKELEKERAERRRVEEELVREKANVKNLMAKLDSEKERFASQRKKDSEYIKSIRHRLQEALNHEHLMESQLDYEAGFRAKLEKELQSLQKSFNMITEPPCVSLSSDSKAEKDLRNFDQCETLKEERQKNRSRSRQKSGATHKMQTSQVAI